MTESEWLTSNDPQRMLEFWRPQLNGWKLRHFGVAACRLVADQFTSDAPGKILALAEQLAERNGDRNELHTQIVGHVREILRDCDSRFGHCNWLMPEVEALLMSQPEAVNLASVFLSWRTEGQAVRETDTLIRYLTTRLSGANESLAQLVRCIMGNPFWPVVFDPNWRSETAVALATGVYAERAFDHLPILADALEEAGCDQPDLLAHCRGPGPHARGCWVVDAVLGKQ